MKYDVVAIPPFDHQLKRLVKKFPSLKTEFANLVESLEKDPTQGKAIGNHCYKIRLAIKSKGKGKSGGARVITHIQVVETTVFLLAIYDKSEQQDISDKEIAFLLSFID